MDLRDVSFHSAALDKDLQYRVILPSHIPSGRLLPVVYLLHGANSSFRDWSNDSGVAAFANRGLILVMPEGAESYYTNSVERPSDRYEDYVASDLVHDVESRFPAARARESRAIIGVSMGGFGAIKLALDHPQLFAFAGALSPAIDVPSRRFTFRRSSQWWHYRSIFGPWGSEARRRNDPFLVAKNVSAAGVPYLYLTCGDHESLLPPNRRFAALLKQNNFRYEFHVVPGGHDWNQWNAQIPNVFERLLERQRLDAPLSR